MKLGSISSLPSHIEAAIRMQRDEGIEPNFTAKLGLASPIPQPTVQIPPGTDRTDGGLLGGGPSRFHMTGTVLDRFMSKVVAGEGHCWIWIGCRDAKGYGQLKIAQRHLRAHRVSYEHFVGSIPDGLQMDHLCGNPSCVNPAHLEPVTARENTLRGNGPSARNARKTHCKHGHPLSGSNLGRNGGWRRCLICNREAMRRSIARRSAARARAKAASKIGSASSIPAPPSAEKETLMPGWGGEADPNNLAFLIRDPALRGAVMGAYRAWEKRQ